MIPFPPVSVLLRGCLPFADGYDLLEKLAATWGEAVGCTQVCLARRNSQAGCVEWFSRANGQEWDDFIIQRRLLPSLTPEQAAQAAAETLPPRGQSFALLASGQIAGWLQVVHPQGELTPPRDWLDQTARLLVVAGHWQESLQEHKLRSLAEFAAGAGHEINNPLGAISGRLQQLLPGEQDPERRRLLETIGGQTLRIRDMIGDWMTFARPPAPVPQPIDARTSWNTVVDRYQLEIAELQLTVSWEGPSCTLWGDPAQWLTVLAEILRNAVQASVLGGSIVCRAALESSHGTLTISDSGSGLSPADREHLFDPFYSGRQAGRGLGFGLSKAWQLCRVNQGDLIYLESNGAGCTFRLRWPLADQQNAAADH